MREQIKSSGELASQVAAFVVTKDMACGEGVVAPRRFKEKYEDSGDIPRREDRTITRQNLIVNQAGRRNYPQFLAMLTEICTTAWKTRLG